MIYEIQVFKSSQICFTILLKILKKGNLVKPCHFVTILFAKILSKLIMPSITISKTNTSILSPENLLTIAQ